MSAKGLGCKENLKRDIDTEIVRYNKLKYYFVLERGVGLR